MISDKKWKETANTLKRGENSTIVGNHAYIDGYYYADSNFLNRVRNGWPGAQLEHTGFGEFYVSTPDGARIDFDRMRGKDFPSQVGRSHQLYDDNEGEAVKELIRRMEESGESIEQFEETEDLGETTASMRIVEGRDPEFFSISIELSNAAFFSEGDDEYESEFEGSSEIARILHDLAETVENSGPQDISLRDVNGNIVGRAWVE